MESAENYQWIAHGLLDSAARQDKKDMHRLLYVGIVCVNNSFFYPCCCHCCALVQKTLPAVYAYIESMYTRLYYFFIGSYHSPVDVQGMIAGVTLGVIAFAALVAAAVVIWHRRHFKSRLPPPGSVYEIGPEDGASASAVAVGTDVDVAEGGDGVRTEQFLSGSLPL